MMAPKDCIHANLLTHLTEHCGNFPPAQCIGSNLKSVYCTVLQEAGLQLWMQHAIQAESSIELQSDSLVIMILISAVS